QAPKLLVEPAFVPSSVSMVIRGHTSASQIRNVEIVNWTVGDAKSHPIRPISDLRSRGLSPNYLPTLCDPILGAKEGDVGVQCAASYLSPATNILYPGKEGA